MISKQDIIEKAMELGYADIGFTTPEPFEEHRRMLEEVPAEYGWTEKVGLNLLEGTDPRRVFPEGKSIIVLIEAYFRQSYPASIERLFGRCYLDDDRVTKDSQALRMKALRSFLRDNGIDSKVPFNLPHRASAMRAGLGSTGKNCMFYSRKASRRGSWVFPLTVVVDREFAPDAPDRKNGCPDWCRNACVSACPTRALKGNGRVDPKRCASYLSYFGRGITPLEFREPMGMYIYGCDRCQDVCPRNSAWLSQELPPNARVAAKAEHFDPRRLLHMTRESFQKNVWPHMFYMSPDDLWKWKMNVARVMGNSLDDSFIDDLERAYGENDDARVKGMIAWSLGRIGGEKAKALLEKYREREIDPVLTEINGALEMLG